MFKRIVLAEGFFFPANAGKDSSFMGLPQWPSF